MVSPAQIVKRKRALKRYVVKHGGNPKGLNFAPVAGPVYRKWIRWLQRREWPTLPDTGTADTRVLAILFPPKPETIGHKALEHAESAIGVKESPANSNDGVIVRRFQATTRAYRAPWCASFVTWSFREAGWTGRGWNLAYVPAWVAAAHQGLGGLRVIGWRDVVAGDVPCFDWGRDGVADHIGIAAGPVDPKTLEFHTCEGNTSADSGGSQSNGGQVAARTRSVHDVVCFIRVT